MKNSREIKEFSLYKRKIIEEILDMGWLAQCFQFSTAHPHDEVIDRFHQNAAVHMG